MYLGLQELTLYYFNGRIFLTEKEVKSKIGGGVAAGYISAVATIIFAFASAIKGTFEFQKNWKLYLKGEYTYTASSETKNLSDYAKVQTMEESEQ